MNHGAKILWSKIIQKRKQLSIEKFSYYPFGFLLYLMVKNLRIQKKLNTN